MYLKHNSDIINIIIKQSLISVPITISVILLSLVLHAMILPSEVVASSMCGSLGWKRRHIICIPPCLETLGSLYLLTTFSIVELKHEEIINKPACKIGGSYTCMSNIHDLYSQ